MTTTSPPPSDVSAQGMDANRIIENINATVTARFSLNGPRVAPLQLSNLCKACKIVFHAECISEHSQEFANEQQPGEVSHHSLDELSAHAVRGCDLCLTVYQSFDPEALGEFQYHLEEMRESQSLNEDVVTNVGFALLDAVSRDQARLVFRWVICQTDSSLPRDSGVHWDNTKKDTGSFPNGHRTTTQTGSNKLKQELKVELILMNPRYAVEPGVKTISPKSTNTSSPESFETAKQWIEECSFNHMKCSANEGTGPIWKPKRLLDVTIYDTQGNQGIKLIDGEFLDPFSEYCTLSHCWGIGRDLNQNPIRLHKGTLSAFRQGIPCSSLPKTFAEAALATVKIGYKYLWIDALCILHDNETEVQNEMANMHRIYSEATLNLAATSSREDTAGLFYNRNAAALKPVVVDVTDGLGIYAGRYKVLRNTTWGDLVDSSPLSKRAWVLQERALCRRTLHFTRSELLWECQQMCCSEVFPKGLPMTISALAAVEERQTRKSTMYKRQVEDSGPQGRRQRTLEKFNKRTHHQQTGNWHSLVEQYSAGRLTYSSDKLPAIAGLAQQYILRNRGLRPSDYVVGMWRSHLSHSLLWNTEEGGRRPHKYRAPSWSWASIEGQITYPDFSERGSIGNKQTCIEIMSIDLKHYNNDDLFGQCESAQLKIRGFLGRGRLRRNQNYWGRCGFTLHCEKGVVIDFVSACFDEKIEALPPPSQQQDKTNGQPGVLQQSERFEVYLLPIIDVHDQVSGLILSATTSRGEFTRIGTFEISSSTAGTNETDNRNWDRFRGMMKGDPNMENYEERLDHTNGYTWASDYTYTINIV